MYRNFLVKIILTYLIYQNLKIVNKSQRDFEPSSRYLFIFPLRLVPPIITHVHKKLFKKIDGPQTKSFKILLRIWPPIVWLLLTLYTVLRAIIIIRALLPNQKIIFIEFHVFHKLSSKLQLSNFCTTNS